MPCFIHRNYEKKNKIQESKFKSISTEQERASEEIIYLLMSWWP